MTKDKFISIHRKRGYEVEDLGKMVILSLDDYTAIHFFNADGTRDKTISPVWKTSRHQGGCFFIPKNDYYPLAGPLAPVPRPVSPTPVPYGLFFWNLGKNESALRIPEIHHMARLSGSFEE